MDRFRDVRHQAAYAGHDVGDWTKDPLAAVCRRCGQVFDRWIRGSSKAIPPCEPRSR